MLVAAGATAAVVVMGLDVETVGIVPAGLPVLTVPWIDPGLWWDLAPNALLIGLVPTLRATRGHDLGGSQKGAPGQPS